MIGAALGGVLKFGARAGLGYGVMKGAGYVADQAGDGVGPYSVGGGITGAIRAAGFLAGGGLMATAGIRSFGRMFPGARIPFTQAKGSRPRRGYTRGASLGKMSVGRLLGGAGAKAGGGLGKLGWAAAMAPLTVAADIGGVVTGAGSNKLSRSLLSVGNKRMGRRMFGWGALLGAGKALTEADRYLGPGHITAPSLGYNLPLGGQQMWDPSRMSRPRGTGLGDGGTSGLVQSLHRLR